MSVQDTIRDQVKSNHVVLYMKGTPQFPQCGFSATVVEILKRSGVSDYLAVDVLKDPEIRQGIKDYANWPTIPQLYVNGEFVGGCDIIREMYRRRAAEGAARAARLTSAIRCLPKGPPLRGPFFVSIPQSASAFRVTRRPVVAGRRRCTRKDIPGVTLTADR